MTPLNQVKAAEYALESTALLAFPNRHPAYDRSSSGRADCEQAGGC